MVYVPEFRDLTFLTRQSGKQHDFGSELFLSELKDDF